MVQLGEWHGFKDASVLYKADCIVVGGSASSFRVNAIAGGSFNPKG